MLGLLAVAFAVAVMYGPSLLQKRWETPPSVFPPAFVTLMLFLATMLGYAVIRSRISLAVGTVGALAVCFSIAVVGFILPAVDAAASARRVSETIKAFPRDPSETLHLYSPRWPDNEDVVYYLNLEPALPRLASEDMLLAKVREGSHILAVMDNTSYTTLKNKPDLSLEPVHEFRLRRNKNLHILKIRLATSAHNSQNGK